MKRTRTYLPTTLRALELLGALIATARRERGWTAAELAERLGVHPTLIPKIESGSPTTGIGTVFEAAVLCGVPLFGEDPQRWDDLATRQRDRLALLPARVRTRVEQVDDDF